MSQITPWCFQGSLQLLKQRAFLLSEIRSFFKHKQVVEVETPVLSSAANNDLQIEVFQTQGIKSDQARAFLRTSPEFFHKRLLASNSGDIFEIAKVFRNGERTRLHNPEFTLLEWYRLDFDVSQLMHEVIELIQRLRQAFDLAHMDVITISYQDLFIQLLNFDPFDINDAQLNQKAIEAGYHGPMLSRSEALDFMFAVCLEPQLNTQTGYLIHEFPLEQAALAQQHPSKPDRCLRFEFLWGGVELANGYQELTDPGEQLKRFEQDNQTRSLQGKQALPIDELLLDAMVHGLPRCSGVAVGIDRLLMCLLGKTCIDDVLGFVAENS